MSVGLPDSAFYMWRTLFALVHADDVVTYEEIQFVAEAFEDNDFSAKQEAVLKEDVKTPQDIDVMFSKITDVKDQVEFFNHARKLVHIDGDFAEEEQTVLLRLQTLHIQETDVDELVGNVQLELEGDGRG